LSKIIKLSNEDREELVKLYERAERTPVLVYSTSPIVRDTASDSWESVRRKMDALGKKYKFDPRQMKGINKKTGEVRL